MKPQLSIFLFIFLITIKGYGGSDIARNTEEINDIKFTTDIVVKQERKLAHEIEHEEGMQITNCFSPPKDSEGFDDRGIYVGEFQKKITSETEILRRDDLHTKWIWRRFRRKELEINDELIISFI